MACNDGVRKVFNHKSLKKEVTESMAMLFALKKTLTKKFSGNVEKASDEEDVFDLEVLKRHQFTFYDICSGRGIASIIFRLFFPNSRVIMVDFNQSINLEFLQASELSSIEFHHFDIYRPEFAEFLVSSTSQDVANGSVSGIFGMHLCGQLSVRLIDLFNNISTIPILVIFPCCMPRRKKGNNVDKMRLMLKNNGWDGYNFWSLDLFGSIQSSTSIKNIESDEYMESDKSKLIWALKRTAL